MRSVINFNDGWISEGRTEVRPPHSAVDEAVTLAGAGSAGLWATATNSGAAGASVSHPQIGEAPIEPGSMRGDQ